ncbi:MAG: integration host factor subunit alpha [Desulfobacterium sp.]|jgi:integration host factor subunit alpha|nr:integration host factor subunit alpha [Desulfobacterium sp.]
MTLTKAQIVDSIQDKFGFPRKKCVELIEIMLEEIKKPLQKGEDVMISGFGKFCVNNKKERKGRNPATGDDLTLPARKVVTFKCSQGLREKINK